MMRHWIVLCLVACRGGSPAAKQHAGSAQPNAAADAVAFTHVTVVPMTSEQELPDQTVVVEGTRIAAVGPSASTTIPPGATVVDGHGAWLLPGLVDMHTHLTEADDRARYLAAGVTAVRVTWGLPATLTLRDHIAKREVTGPWIYTSGPIMDGDPPVWPGSVMLHTPDEAVRAADEQKQQGFEMLKVYDRIPADAYLALAAEAKKNGQRLIGHVPEAVGLAKVLEVGQASIEHLEGYGHFVARDRAAADKPVFSPGVDMPGWIGLLEDQDPARVEEAVKLTKQAGTWNVPTLVVLDRYANLDKDASRNLPGVETVSPSMIEEWSPEHSRLQMKPADFERMRRALPGASKLVGALHAGGARILAGTDAGNPFVVAGYALLDEIVRLHEAGLSNFEALRAATSAPAEFLLATKEFGTVTPGLRADLVLVEGDPLKDLHALERRRGVVANGRWFPQADLDRQIADITATNHGKRSRFIGVPPLPVEGTRLFTARYIHGAADATSAEERVVIDRDAGGHTIVTSEMRGRGDQTVRAVIDGSGTALTQTDENGSLELVREGATVHASYTPAGGKPMKQDAPLAADALFSSTTIAPDHIFYARLAALPVGGKGEWKLASPATDRWVMATLRGVRKPDAQRTVAGDTITVRVFDIEFVDDARTQKGSIVLDADGHLVESALGGDTIVRAE
ncbi:MAG TPA: amidohydrolase family protein [Kofleriaceae bacterium]|nr:amidohydrolase family protein [Kofleriaceae bacterium]